MTNYNNIIALANQIKPKIEEPEENLSVTYPSHLSQNEAATEQQGTLFDSELVPIVSVDAPPTPDPALVARYQASVATFLTLGNRHYELGERIKKGVEYCKSNPSSKEAYQLLAKLRKEQAEVQTRLDAEAEIQYDLEQQIAGPGRVLCNECWGVKGNGTYCACDADAVKCAVCERPILDSVVNHPGNGQLMTLSSERIVEITTEKLGKPHCLAHYRANLGAS